MNIDDLDTEILVFLLENPNRTAYETALACLKKKARTRTVVHAAEEQVRYHLRRLERYGLVKRTQRDKLAVYATVPSRTMLGDGTLLFKVKGADPYSMDMGEYLIVTNGSNRVYVRSLSERS